MSNPRDLFLELLSEALWVERILVFETLPRLRGQVSATWLEQAVAEHEQHARLGVDRLEAFLRTLGVEPVSVASEAFRGLQREHDARVGAIVEPRLRDVWIADHLERTARLELSLQAELAALARALGADVEPLEQGRTGCEQALAEIEHVSARLHERLPGASPAGQRN